MSVDPGISEAAADLSALLAHTLPLNSPAMQQTSLLPVATLKSASGDAPLAVFRCNDSVTLQASSARFIRGQYWATHQATLTSLMYQRFALLDSCDMPCAVVGLKPFESSQALVERYLDEPIQQLVSQVLGRRIPRESLIEVGNLAADSLIQSVRLIIFLLHWLKWFGISHAVCTGTEAVRLALKRARVPFQVIGAADPNRLGDERWHWGSYYQNAPQILLIDIEQGLAAVSGRYQVDLMQLETQR